MYMSISEIVEKIENGKKLFLYNSRKKDVIYFNNGSFFIKNKEEEYEIYDIKNYLKRIFCHGVKATFSEELYNSSDTK